MKDVLPFANAFTVSSPELPSREGYITKVYGIFLTVAPVPAVTGPGTLSVTELANPLSFSSGPPVSPGQLLIQVTPSTTEVVNVPVHLGEHGVQGQLLGQFGPISVTYTPNGSDDNTATINAWGELVKCAD